MAKFDEHNLPDDLRDVEERLRRARPSFTELELDQLKRRTMAKFPERGPSIVGRTRGKPMRSRVLTLALTALLIGGTAGGAIAGGAGGNSSNSAREQYKPGNGCGDKNHVHTGPPGNPDNHKCPPQSDDHGNGNGHDNGNGNGNGKKDANSSSKGNDKKDANSSSKGNDKKDANSSSKGNDKSSSSKKK
jgi:hypothetical protein